MAGIQSPSFVLLHLLTLSLFPAHPPLTSPPVWCTTKSPDLGLQIHLAPPSGTNVPLLAVPAQILSSVEALHRFLPALGLKSDRHGPKFHVSLLLTMWLCIFHVPLLWFNFPICQTGATIPMLEWSCQKTGQWWLLRKVSCTDIWPDASFPYSLLSLIPSPWFYFCFGPYLIFFIYTQIHLLHSAVKFLRSGNIFFISWFPLCLV